MIPEGDFVQHIGIRDYQEKQPCCLHLLWLVHTQPKKGAYTPSELWNLPHILQVSQSTYNSYSLEALLSSKYQKYGFLTWRYPLHSFLSQSSWTDIGGWRHIGLFSICLEIKRESLNAVETRTLKENMVKDTEPNQLWFFQEQLNFKLCHATSPQVMQLLIKCHNISQTQAHSPHFKNNKFKHQRQQHQHQ